MTDITIRRPVQWLSSSDTNVGVVRKINEDAIFSRPDIKLWAVADGMGGHEAGNIASGMIVRTLGEIDIKNNLNNFVAILEDTILDVNKRLLEYSEIMLGGKTVGSTVAILLIKGNVGICMWAGDSRLYRYRNNNLEQITIDHSYVTELLKKGSISTEEAENHPDSNVITRAVGTCESLYIDIDVFDVGMGDTFMLCTDGLYNAVANESIVDCLQEDNVETAVNSLIQTALNNNASDNVSVVLVKGMHGNENQ